MKRKENNYIRTGNKEKKQGKEGKRSDKGNTKDFSKERK